MSLRTEVLCRSCHVYQTKEPISFSFLTLTSERFWALVWWLCSPIHVWILYFRIIMKYLRCVSSKNTSEKAWQVRMKPQNFDFMFIFPICETVLDEFHADLSPSDIFKKNQTNCHPVKVHLNFYQFQGHMTVSGYQFKKSATVFGFPAVDGHPLLGSSTRCDIQLYFYKQFQAFHVLL